jgi:hypothetical protein
MWMCCMPICVWELCLQVCKCKTSRFQLNPESSNDQELAGGNGKGCENWGPPDFESNHDKKFGSLVYTFIGLHIHWCTNTLVYTFIGVHSLTTELYRKSLCSHGMHARGVANVHVAEGNHAGEYIVKVVFLSQQIHR